MCWAEHGPRGWVAVPVFLCVSALRCPGSTASRRRGRARGGRELPVRGHRAPVTPGPTALLFQAGRPGPLPDCGASGGGGAGIVPRSTPLPPAALTHGFRESWQCPWAVRSRGNEEGKAGGPRGGAPGGGVVDTRPQAAEGTAPLCVRAARRVPPL